MALTFTEEDFLPHADAYERLKAEGAPDPLASGNELLTAIAEHPKGFVKSLPGDVFSVAAAPGKLAYLQSADWLSDLTGDKEYGGNLEALKQGKEELPVDKFVNSAAKESPALALATKISESAPELASQFSINPTGTAGRLVALGFSAKTVVDAKPLFDAYADEVNKPKEQQDAGKLNDLKAGIIQTFAVAPLAGMHGVRAPDTVTALATALKRGQVQAPFQAPQAQVQGALPAEADADLISQQINAAIAQPAPEQPAPQVTEGRVFNTPMPKLPIRVQPGPVSVPETPPEAGRDVNVIAQIRQAGAKTTADIQRLFPQAGLNREAAKKFRDQAWGKPEQPAAKPVFTEDDFTKPEPAKAGTTSIQPTEVQNAIPERSTAPVSMVSAPGDSETVGGGVSAPAQPAEAQKEEVSPAEAARPIPTLEEARAQNLPMQAKASILEYDSIQKILNSGKNPDGSKLTKQHRTELLARIPQVVSNFEEDATKPAAVEQNIPQASEARPSRLRPPNVDPKVLDDMNTLTARQQIEKYGMSKTEIIQAHTVSRVLKNMVAEGKNANGTPMTAKQEQEMQAEIAQHQETLDDAAKLKFSSAKEPNPATTGPTTAPVMSREEIGTRPGESVSTPNSVAAAEAEFTKADAAAKKSLQGWIDAEAEYDRLVESSPDEKTRLAGYQVKVAAKQKHELQTAILNTATGDLSLARYREQVKGVPNKQGPAPEIKITPKVLKTQKESLLAQVDDAIKSASAEPSAEKITISVPGDGEFTIHNNKRSLKQFRDVAAKQFPTTSGAASEPGLPSGKGRTPARVSEPTPDDLGKIAGDFISTDEGRHAITVSYADGTQIVSTDGRQLMRIVSDKAPGSPSKPVIMDAKGKIVTEDHGNYPNYNAVIPESNEVLRGGADTGELYHIVRQAQMFRDVSLAPNERTKASMSLWVNADRSLGGKLKTPDQDEFEHNVQAGAHFLGNYNPDYLENAINAARKLGNQTVDLLAPDESGPMTIRGKNFEYVVMPIRVSDEKTFRTIPPIGIGGRSTYPALPRGLEPFKNPEGEISQNIGTDAGNIRATIKAGQITVEKIIDSKGKEPTTYAEVASFKLEDLPKGTEPQNKFLKSKMGNEFDKGNTVVQTRKAVAELLMQRADLLSKAAKRAAIKPGPVKGFGGAGGGEPVKLKPALLINGVAHTGGKSHSEILTSIMHQASGAKDADLLGGALDAFADDSKHVFVDQHGKVYNRMEAAAALGLDEPLQSHQLPDEDAGEGVKSFGGGTGNTVPPANTPPALAKIQRTMMPGLTVAKNFKQAVLSLLLPSAKSPAHLTQAEILGSKLGGMDRRNEAANHQLNPHSRRFDRLGLNNPNLTPDKNAGMKFMGDMSTGRPVDPRFAATAKLITKLFDDAVQALADLGKPIQTARDNYFPGMWTAESRAAFNAAMQDAQAKGLIPPDFDVNNATPALRAQIKAKVDEYIAQGTGDDHDMLSYFTRRPLKGKESFRKEKVFDDVMNAAEFGLRPVSNNPIDLVKGKLAELNRAIMAEEYFAELRERGELKTVSPYDKTPEGWQRLNDKYGTIYGAPTVKVPEWLDKNVYDGLVKFAASLGISHERTMKFPPGPGNRALGLSYTGQNFVRTKFATETSVLAHEIGHQIDDRYDFWNLFVDQAQGEPGAKGKPTKAGNAKAREKIRNELRNVADLTGGRGGNSRKREEQIAQMFEAYVHAPERMRAVAPTVFNLLDNFLASKPELAPLREIKPGIELQRNTADKYVGLPIMGYRIVPEAAADIVNNYLSSSLYNNAFAGGFYKGWMASANTLNQSQLGLGSAFHLAFTTGDATVSAGASVLKDVYGVARGNRSVKDLGNSLVALGKAPVATAMQGDRILNAWRNPDAVADPKVAAVVKAAELAGGGFKLEHGMRTEQYTKMLRNWYSRQRVKAALRSPFALTELMAKPIMDYIVPRQKAGVFADLAGRIIEQNPNVPLEDLRPQFRQAWNRIDARLGQVRYKRLFTQTMTKEILQGTVRAPGWSGGTIAELGGAFPDAANFFREWIKTGKAPENIPDRVAYTASLLLTVSLTNGLLTYLYTGQMPHGMDYMAFRTGQKNKDGTAQRYLLPSYMKDVLAYARHPWQTLANKSHPILSTLDDVALKNRDYYGYEIRDPDAPYGTQGWQAGKYLLQSFEPFWTRGVRQASRQGKSFTSIVAPYFGIMPAPSSVTLSPIREEINALYAERRGDPTKPYAQRAAEAQKQKTYDPTMTDIYKFRHLPKSDQEGLLRKMTEEERQRYAPQSVLSE